MGIIENDDTQAVNELKALLNEKARYLTQDLQYIVNNYSFLIDTIKQLESGSLRTKESLRLFNNVKERVEAVKCATGQKIWSSFKDNFENNPDLGKLVEMLEDSSPDSTCIHYSNCLLTSVDVERTFSRYKNIFRDNRSSFLFENLRKYVFIHCNSYYDE